MIGQVVLAAYGPAIGRVHGRREVGDEVRGTIVNSDNFWDLTVKQNYLLLPGLK